MIWFGLLGDVCNDACNDACNGVGAEGGLQLCEYAVKQGFQTTFFGRSEFIGNGELGQTHESLADVLKASLEDGDGG